VRATFQLEEVPTNIERNYDDYQTFREYLENKGSYKPNKKFLDHILQLIEEDKFPRNKRDLQDLESVFFMKEESKNLADKFMQNILRTVNSTREIQGLGSDFLKTLINHPKDKEVFPTLMELCKRALRKNGFPQKFISLDNLNNEVPVNSSVVNVAAQSDSRILINYDDPYGNDDLYT
jgi:hypothetical protein